MSAALPLDTLAQAVRRLPGDRRMAALAAFVENGFPGPRAEDWKYTDLGPAISISRDWLLAGAPEAPVDSVAIEAAKAEIDAHWLVIANGKLLAERSTARSLAGLAVLDDAMPDEDFSAPLADLNAALCPGIVAIDVGRDFSADKPIGLLFADTAGDSASVAHAGVRITLEEHAEADFVEYHCSTGVSAHYSNTRIAIALGRGANCRLVRLQARAIGHSHTGRLEARLDREARLAHFCVDLGGSLVRNDLVVDIAGRDASATLDGVYLAGPGQHVDNHTRTEHRVGPAHSSQEYRGVLGGRCRGVWNGKVIVHEGADGTDAQQANHNLLLSEHAEINAKPELEIYAEDVKCAHGTTVGQLDERALFYLRSRGIGPARARRILTRAFAQSVVDRLPLESLRDTVGRRVEQHLREMTSENNV